MPDNKEKILWPIVVVEETIIMIEGELWFRHDHNKRKQNVQLILTTLINNSNVKIMSLSMNQGKISLGTVGLVDTDTQQGVGATFANVSFSVDDGTIATVEQLTTDPNTCKVTGVAVGSTNVNAKADVTYTDSKTNQQVTKTLTSATPVTITQEAGENVALVINFTTPQ